MRDLTIPASDTWYATKWLLLIPIIGWIAFLCAWWVWAELSACELLFD